MNKFKVYENSGGAIILYLFEGEKVKKVFEGWECGRKSCLLNAINQLAEDFDAWKSWDGDLLDRVDGRYVIDDIDEETGIVSDHFEPYTVEDFYDEDKISSDLIASGQFDVFTIYIGNMGASGYYVFGIDDLVDYK